MRRTGPKKKRATMRLKRCLPEGEGTRTNTLPRGYANSRHRTSYSCRVKSTHTTHGLYLSLTLTWSWLAPSIRATLSMRTRSIHVMALYRADPDRPSIGRDTPTPTHTALVLCLAIIIIMEDEVAALVRNQLTHTHTHTHTHSLTLSKRSSTMVLACARLAVSETHLP